MQESKWPVWTPIAIGTALVLGLCAYVVWHAEAHVCVRSRPSTCLVQIGTSLVAIPCDECLEYAPR